MSSIFREDNIPFIDHPSDLFEHTALSQCIEGITEYSRIFYDLFPAALLSVCVSPVQSGEELWRANHWHQQSLQHVLEGLARARFQAAGGPRPADVAGGAVRALLERGPLLAPDPSGRAVRARLLWVLGPHDAAASHAAALAGPLARALLAAGVASADVLLLQVLAPGQAPAPAHAHAEPLPPHIAVAHAVVGAGEQLARWGALADLHLGLRRVSIAGIPMKEKDAAGERAVYSVTLLHPAGGHASDAPLQLAWRGGDKRAGPGTVAGTCAHRVTALAVHAGPTVCLMKHLLGSPKPVLLGSSRDVPASHLLQLHGGDLWLHCLHAHPPPHPLEQVPSAALLPHAMALPPYRFEDFGALMHAAQLQPRRTGQAGGESAARLLERATRYWPLHEHDTVLLARDQSNELRTFTQPVRSLLLADRPDEAACEISVSLLARLQAFAAQNEPLLFPQLAGTPVARQEAYKRLWQELLTLARTSAAIAGASPLKTRVLTAMARLWPDLAPPELRPAPAAASPAAAASTSSSAAAAPAPPATTAASATEDSGGKRKRDREGVPAKRKAEAAPTSVYHQFWNALRPPAPAREFAGRQDS